jgi:hypothetical protein
MKMQQMIHSMKPTIVKNKLRIFFTVSAFLIFNSCYFPGYQSVAETSLHNISFAEGKWFVNYVTIDGKPFTDFSEYSEKELQNCLQDSLYLSYGKRKAIYNVPILNSKNLKESLSLLKASKTIDYVIQITGSIGANEIGNINIKPMKNAEKTAASITFKVYEVSTEQLVYSQTTTGQLTVENNSEDVLFGKSAQNILKKCLKKGMKQLKKSGGCEK